MAAAKRGATSSPAARAKRSPKRGAKVPLERAKRAADSVAPPGTFRPFEALKRRVAAVPPDKKAAEPPHKKATSPRDKKPAGGISSPRAPGSADAEPAPLTFASAMRGVRPLDPGVIRVALPSDDDEAAAATLRSLVMSGLTFEVLDDGAALQGRRIDVDPRELRRLRQQHYAVDGTLDLHKHTVAEARVAVVAFVARRAREGDKVIAIVHGKGRHSIGGESVLRGELGAWLSQGDAARHVHAFASVVDPDGASGKLLVKIG